MAGSGGRRYRSLLRPDWGNQRRPREARVRAPPRTGRATRPPCGAEIFSGGRHEGPPMVAVTFGSLENKWAR